MSFEQGIFDVCGLAGDVCSPYGDNDDCCAGLTCDGELGTCVAAP